MERRWADRRASASGVNERLLSPVPTGAAAMERRCMNTACRIFPSKPSFECFKLRWAIAREVAGIGP
jgi:hypothetical protein